LVKNNRNVLFSEVEIGIGLGTSSGSANYKYKYNGKELQEELNLNIYAYGWRDYDPAIGRFNKIDRFAEKYTSITPYNYALNNPSYFIDVKGDSIAVPQQYRSKINTILEQSFGENASNFSYSSNGMLVFNGNKKSLSNNERKAFNVLSKLMNSKTTYNVIIEQSFSITKTDGTTEQIDTGQNGAQGDAAVYPEATKNKEGYIGLNPTPSNIKVNVVDVEYDKDGKQKAKNMNDIFNPPQKSYTIYENFWHAVGHLDGGSGNLGRAMEVENMGGTIRKTSTTSSDGTKTYTPATIQSKNYNLDHPRK